MIETLSRRKYLLIRFSSLGDVLQSLSVLGRLHEDDIESEFHFLTRSDMKALIENHPGLKQLWLLDRKQGFLGLLKLALALRREKFTHVYDIHNNLRSNFIGWILCWPRLSQQKLCFLKRSIRRWKRFLLFRFRINRFEMPFNGQRDLLEPLRKWGFNVEAPAVPQLFFEPDIETKAKNRLKADWQGPALPEHYIALAPSASYPLKRWPLEYWVKLVETWKGPNFIILGGPDDHFVEEIRAVAPERVWNFAGFFPFHESAYLVDRAKLLISNDTGLLHVAEQRGVQSLALMGPAPFGFPSRPLTQILELELDCRPCSKHGQGPCVNPEFQKCLRGISPQQVLEAGRAKLESL